MVSRRVLPFLVLAVLPLGPACSSTGETVASPAEVARARSRAEAATAELLQTLMRRLTGALGESGPEGAIGVCAEVAQELTGQGGERHGVAIRRTALRWRNPANAPDPWERAWMERALASKEKVVPTAEVVARPDGRLELRYARPIFLVSTCLQCHGSGEEIPAAVRQLLAERYPEDRATGFRRGDLRGIVSVRVPLAGEGS